MLLDEDLRRGYLCDWKLEVISEVFARICRAAWKLQLGVS